MEIYFYISVLFAPPHTVVVIVVMYVHERELSHRTDRRRRLQEILSVRLVDFFVFLHIFLLSFTASQRAAARQMTSCVIYKGMMTSANDEESRRCAHFNQQQESNSRRSCGSFPITLLFSAFSLISHRISLSLFARWLVAQCRCCSLPLVGRRSP